LNWDVFWNEIDNDNDSEVFIEQLKSSIGTPHEIYHHFEGVENSERHVGWAKAYLFAEYRAKEIYTNTLSGNIAMVRLAEKIGFEIKHTTPSLNPGMNYKY